jgi:hypothetical protein
MYNTGTTSQHPLAWGWAPLCSVRINPKKKMKMLDTSTLLCKIVVQLTYLFFKIIDLNSYQIKNQL